MSFALQYESFARSSAAEGYAEEAAEALAAPAKLWIPDAIVLVCHACEEPFSVFRRRHHCRVCGHVFCHPCCSWYIDGALLRLRGGVRACLACYEQMSEQEEREQTAILDVLTSEDARYVNGFCVSPRSRGRAAASEEAPVAETEQERTRRDMRVHIEARAQSHLARLSGRALGGAGLDEGWRALVLRLASGIVGAVQPDVRRGDDMDINKLVHFELVPGGSAADSRLVQGTCLRRSPAQRRMALGHTRAPVRFLLIRAIDLRTAHKFTSLDRLLELENRALEVFLVKVLSLRPDVLLLGGGASHVALERLCAHGVVVLQNVDADTLARVARVTGAEVLASSQHISRLGTDPVGTAASFALRRVQDDPEHPSLPRAKGILKTNLATDSCFAFIEGCDPRLGCAVFLRGGDRALLERVRALVQLLTLAAYHLQLERSLYADRDAHLPAEGAAAEEPGDSDDERAPCEEPHSLSLDVRYGCPNMRDIEGDEALRRVVAPRPDPVLALSTVSLVMAGKTHKSHSERRTIRFYGEGDTCLGRFLIDNCFQPAHRAGAAPVLLNHTLSFAHNPGRVDVTVTRASEERAAAPAHLTRFLPVLLSVFCRACNSQVSPETELSENSWKLSFGCFLETMFYNRAAYGSSFGCSHCCRDHHVYSFACVGLVTRISFVPFHSFAIRTLGSISIASDFHLGQARRLLLELLDRCAALETEFGSTLAKLRLEVQELGGADDRADPPSRAAALLLECGAREDEMSGALHTFADKLRSFLQSMDSVHTFEAPVYFRYPLSWKRDLGLLCESCNRHIESLSSSVEEVVSRAAKSEASAEHFSFFRPRGESNDDAKAEARAHETALPGEDAASPVSPGPRGEQPAPDPDPRHDEKKSSISKALALLLGTDSIKGKRRAVPLLDLADPSFELPPGRKGEVIRVSEHEPVSVVAYALASRAYCDELLRLREDERLDLADEDAKLSFLKTDEPSLGRQSPLLRDDRLTPIAVPPSSADPPQLDALGTPLEAPVPAEERVLSPALSDASDSDLFYARADSSVSTGSSLDELPAFNEEDERALLEREMLLQRRSHIKQRFRDSAATAHCKYVCTAYWSTQFEAFRRAFFDDNDDDNYVLSLASSEPWGVQGGKSGASFSKTTDGRFVVKAISNTELLMFNDFAPAYFEYMSKVVFAGLPTVLCKIFGVYRVGFHNLGTSKRATLQLVVIENLFYQQRVTRVFDLKGSTRARYVAEDDECTFEQALLRRRRKKQWKRSELSSLEVDALESSEPTEPSAKEEDGEASQRVLLDDNFVQLNSGRPFPLKKRAKEYLDKAVMNDTSFLSVVNVVDYSILLGVDESGFAVKAGIIDYLRQYDIIKKMEHMSKSVGMLTGQAEPTIIEPSQYKRRFLLALDRYFMEVPDAWSEGG